MFLYNVKFRPGEIGDDIMSSQYMWREHDSILSSKGEVVVIGDSYQYIFPFSFQKYEFVWPHKITPTPWLMQILFYTNFTNTTFQKVPIPHLTCTMKFTFAKHNFFPEKK